MAVEVAVEVAVEFQSGCRKKSGSRKAPHHIMILPPTSQIGHHHKVTNITMSPTSLSPRIHVAHLQLLLV